MDLLISYFLISYFLVLCWSLFVSNFVNCNTDLTASMICMVLYTAITDILYANARRFAYTFNLDSGFFLRLFSLSAVCLRLMHYMFCF